MSDTAGVPGGAPAGTAIKVGTVLVNRRVRTAFGYFQAGEVVTTTYETSRGEHTAKPAVAATFAQVRR